MSLNLWIQHLARISLPWWSTPCTIHTFILCKPQIMWYVSKSQSTSIHVYQINVESEINVLHIKSPFRCSESASYPSTCHSHCNQQHSLQTLLAITPGPTNYDTSFILAKQNFTVNFFILLFLWVFSFFPSQIKQ
jgi:hypothetical protein